MKNSSIFATLLAVLAATALLATTDRTRTATVVGRFSDRLGGIDYKWAYLYDGTDDSTILDSCQILGNRFSLKTGVRSDSCDYRIAMPQLDYEAWITLRPRHTLELNIDPEPFERMLEEEIREAIERLDSTGVSLPDSIWLKIQQTAYNRSSKVRRPSR